MSCYGAFQVGDRVTSERHGGDAGRVQALSDCQLLIAWDRGGVDWLDPQDCERA